MDRLTVYDSITPANRIYASKRILTIASRLDVTGRYATVDELPANMGDTMNLRRYQEWPEVTAPMSEYLNPESFIPTFEDFQVTVEPYGQSIRLTSKIADMHQDPVGKIQADRAAQSAARTAMKVDFNALKAGTNVSFGGTGTTRLTVNGAITNNLLKGTLRQLENDGATPITRRLAAGPNVATEPVPEGFVCFGHVNHLADLEKLDGWIPVHKYAEAKSADPGEKGACEGFRFILNRDAPVFIQGATSVSSTTFLSNKGNPASASNPDVYPLIAIGQDSWSRVPLKGKNAIVPIVLNPGHPSIGDVMGRFGAVSWWAYFAAVLTNQAWIHRIEVGATAL
jgi:N4-gp56 family major capsid protein